MILFVIYNYYTTNRMINDSMYNILLIGNIACGKSTYINMLLGNILTDTYIPTNINNSQEITFNTNYGVIKYNIVEWSQSLNAEDNIILPEKEILNKFNAFIFMTECSKESKQYCKKIILILTELKLINNPESSVPIFMIQSKSDIYNQLDKMYTQQNQKIPYIMTHINKNSKRHEIEVPLLRIARSILKSDEVEFIH
jgi:GTPase SAR1 family protein